MSIRMMVVGRPCEHVMILSCQIPVIQQFFLLDSLTDGYPLTNCKDEIACDSSCVDAEILGLSLCFRHNIMNLVRAHTGDANLSKLSNSQTVGSEAHSEAVRINAPENVIHAIINHKWAPSGPLNHPVEVLFSDK